MSNGYPVLDEDFQSSVLNLFFPGFPASRDSGPFFGFVAGAPVAATIIVSKLTGRST